MIQLPITGGFYQNRSLPISSQQCVNWYVNKNQGRALSDESLFGTPGIIRLATTGEVYKGVLQVNRGGLTVKGKPYFVNGQTLWRIESDFSATEIGTVQGSERVEMSENGKQLMVLVPKGNAYIYDLASDAFQEITDPDFRANGNPVSVAFIDGYFALSTDQDKIIVSNLNDGLAYDALDFASAEADTDGLVRLIAFQSQLYALGRETIEVFQNIGGAQFPFERVSGFIINKGCFSQFSAIDTPDTFVFVGGGRNESPSIYAMEEQTAVKISTDSIDGILQDLSSDDIRSCFSWQYTQAGARFIGFSFFARTFVYDLSSKVWHERTSTIVNFENRRTTRWRVNSMLTAYNKVIVADSQDGRIGGVSLDEYAEYSGDIVRVVSTAPFSNQGNSLFVSALELTVESGQGDAKITLATSNDGRTFSDSITRSIGKTGTYIHRVIWRRLGRFSRFAIFRFTMSGRVKPVIVKLEADIKGGAK